MNAPLPSLPLPLMTTLLCLVLAGLMLRLDPGPRRMPILLSALFALLATQALLVAARFAYGIDRLTVVQGALQLFTGPLLYLSFVTLAVSDIRWRRMAAIHFGIAIALFLGAQFMPIPFSPLDGVIACSFLIYVILLARLWRQGPGALVHARLDLLETLSRWLLGATLLLLLMLVIDSAIAASFAMRQFGQALALISYGSGVMIVLLALLVGALPRFLPQPMQPQPETPVSEPPEELAALEAQARKLLTSTRLYLDPGLTVQRLARRLHMPERRLSRAINQTCGLNLSQYVNGFRLEHAASLLRETETSVASVMTESGFLTRSNFYREFQRVYGMSPASYRAQPFGSDTKRGLSC